MGSVVEVTVESARELKNVNWRNGDLRPYVVLWINDDGPKCSTRVSVDAGESHADWAGEKVLVPLPPSVVGSRRDLEDAVLNLDVVHANTADDEEEVKKPLVGSARLPLRDVLDEGKVSRTLRLKRPSGRPQGRLDVRVAVKEREPATRYYDPSAYPAPYGQPVPGAGTRDAYYAQAQPGYAQPGPYAAPPSGYPVAVPAGAGYDYGYNGAGAAPPTQPAYGYGAPTAAVDPSADQKKSGGKMGMGTGLAVGAAAGVLGGLALAGGASYLEDKFEDHVDEKVEEELAARDDEGYDEDY